MWDGGIAILHEEAVMNADERKQARYRAASRVTVVGGVMNVVLSAFKLVAGILGNSAAMVADALHSLSDLASDVVVLVGMRLGKREPDKDHPWGHGKYETLATSALALILLGVAGSIAVDAVHRLQHAGDLAPPTSIALYAALASILTKEALFHYTIAVGRKWEAPAIVANAWHHRSDAISSVAALLGIGGAMLGVPMLDPLAAIAVAVILAKVGGELLLGALRELTDSIEAVDEDIRVRIAELVDRNPDVLSAHSLRARRLGPDVLVDVHVVVERYLSVSEGHQIAERVENTLLTQVPTVSHVMVHVDTSEDDLTGEAIPLYDTDRAALLAQARAALLDDGPLVRVLQVTPHFSSAGIELDVDVEPTATATVAAVRAAAAAFERRLTNLDTRIERVRTRVVLTAEG